MSKRFEIRCISVVMCVALLWGLLAIGAALPASAAIVIDEIAVSVMEPIAGRNPRYEYTLQTSGVFVDVEDDTYGDCQENGIVWFCDGIPIPATSCFEVGKSYTVWIPLYRSSEEYTFDANAIKTINGNTAWVQFSSPNYICIEYTFPALQGYTVSFYKGSGSGTMEPVTGVAGAYQLPECTFTPPNSSQEFKAWRISTDDNDWYPGETVTVHQNITVTATWKRIDSRQAIYDVVATSENLASIPVLYGKMDIPQITVTSGAPAYITASSGNLRWQKKEGDTWVNDSGNRFTPGEWRIATQVRIDDRTDATNQYVLGNPVTLTVNGQAWIPENGTGKPSVYYNYSLIFFYSPTFVIEDDPSIQPPSSVEEVKLRLEGYRSGKPVADAVVTGSEGIRIVGFMLMEADSAEDFFAENPANIREATRNFSTDKYYVAQVAFTAKDGYVLDALTYESISFENATDKIFEYGDGENYTGVYLLNTAPKCTVTFNANGGSSVAPLQVDYGQKIAKPAAPTRSGYEFKGWTYKGATYDFGSAVKGDITLDAAWVKKAAHTHTYQKVITKATLTKDGKIRNKCTACGYVASKVTAIKRVKTVKLSATSYTYNGKAKKPTVSVKDSTGKTVSSKYYTVTYAKGRKNVGTYKVTVKFKGNYSGTKALTFKVNPPKTTVKGLTAGKKSLKVSITKKSSQVTGYQVQYSTSKKFTKATTKTVKSYKTTSYTLKSLSAKKTYYVRVRTYKTVSGKKYYSAWSTAKYKKTK